MKTKILCGLAMIVALACNTASAQIEFLFSESDSSADAVSSLDMFLGDTDSLYLWIVNNDAGAINSVQIDVLSSDDSVLQALAHNIDNSGGQWFDTDAGDLGDLVIDADALSFVPTGGVQNDGVAALFSEVVFEATELGSTELTIQEQADGGVVATTSGAPASLTFGQLTVNVSAIPEPSSLAVLGLAAGIFGLRRRRN